eukprot:25185-Rhodomonas_salina.1
MHVAKLVFTTVTAVCSATSLGLALLTKRQLYSPAVESFSPAACIVISVGQSEGPDTGVMVVTAACISNSDSVLSWIDTGTLLRSKYMVVTCATRVSPHGLLVHTIRPGVTTVAATLNSWVDRSVSVSVQTHTYPPAPADKSNP